MLSSFVDSTLNLNLQSLNDMIRYFLKTFFLCILSLIVPLSLQFKVRNAWILNMCFLKLLPWQRQLLYQQSFCLSGLKCYETTLISWKSKFYFQSSHSWRAQKHAEGLKCVWLTFTRWGFKTVQTGSTCSCSRKMLLQSQLQSNNWTRTETSLVQRDILPLKLKVHSADKTCVLFLELLWMQDFNGGGVCLCCVGQIWVFPAPLTKRSSVK